MLTRPLLFASVLAVTLVGCREAKISSYRVHKEAVSAARPAAVPPAGAETPRLKYQAPASWQEQPGNAVRVASFTITASDGRKADLGITQFPGDVGGDLANVNRWRGQLQLGPIAQTDLAKALTTLDLPAGKFLLVDLKSETPILDDGKHHGRILGAWLKQPERTWFFKMAGESDLIGTEREAFLAFLRTVQFVAPDPTAMPTTQGTMPNDATHAGLPGASGAGAAGMPAMPGTPGASASTPPGGTEPAADNAIVWSAPADWTAKPLAPMRKGSYTLRGANGGEADLSISSFPGDAGGMAQNLNRWRGQLQLPTLGDAEIAAGASTVTSGALRFTVVDYVGKSGSGPTRLVGAVLPLANETYFFKLMGPEAVVEQHKAAFLEFLKTVKTR